MNCKHSEKNYCKLFEKQVTDGVCKNCVMRLPKDDFIDVFQSFINKNGKKK